MFNLFRENRNDNERDEGGPRIVFANLRQSNRPILSEQGYIAFSATTFSIWTLLIFIIWVFRIEVSPSRDSVISIASSSVELAALSLAVLGILHELNKEDKWFKLGLFLVSIFFACVVFSGFFLSMTWRPEYNDPQQITILVVAALGVVAIAQVNWSMILKYIHGRRATEITLSRKVSVTARYFRLSLPFIFPLFIIWFPNLNRLTATIVVFSGALIALVALMGVTTISLLRSPKESEPEDPFIATLRARYENEIKVIIRFGELKAKTIEALLHLQSEHIQIASQTGTAPTLVDKSSIIVRLRQMDITDDERMLEDVIRFLTNEGAICSESYSGPYWIVPNKQDIDDCLKHFGEIALVCTQKGSDVKSGYILEGYKFEALRNWLATHAELPEFVVGAYVMPKVLELLQDPQKYHVVKHTDYGKTYYSSYVVEIFVFVNLAWKIPTYDWSNQLQEIEGIMAQYRTEYRKRDALEALLKCLPHTMDASFYSLDSINFDLIVFNLLKASPSTHLESI